MDGLRQYIKRLPQSVPEAEGDDVLARFTGKVPLVERDKAWQVLDPMLNNVMGWGASVEKVAGMIRRGSKGWRRWSGIPRVLWWSTESLVHYWKERRPSTK